MCKFSAKTHTQLYEKVCFLHHLMSHLTIESKSNRQKSTSFKTKAFLFFSNACTLCRTLSKVLIHRKNVKSFVKERDETSMVGSHFCCRCRSNESDILKKGFTFRDLRFTRLACSERSAEFCSVSTFSSSVIELL